MDLVPEIEYSECLFNIPLECKSSWCKLLQTTGAIK